MIRGSILWVMVAAALGCSASDVVVVKKPLTLQTLSRKGAVWKDVEVVTDGSMEIKKSVECPKTSDPSAVPGRCFRRVIIPDGTGARVEAHADRKKSVWAIFTVGAQPFCVLFGADALDEQLYPQLDDADRVTVVASGGAAHPVCSGPTTQWESQELAATLLVSRIADRWDRVEAEPFPALSSSTK